MPFLDPWWLHVYGLIPACLDRFSLETWLGCTMEEVTDMLEAHFDEHRCGERQARVGG